MIRPNHFFRGRELCTHMHVCLNRAFFLADIHKRREIRESISQDIVKQIYYCYFGWEEEVRLYLIITRPWISWRTKIEATVGNTWRAAANVDCWKEPCGQWEPHASPWNMGNLSGTSCRTWSLGVSLFQPMSGSPPPSNLLQKKKNKKKKGRVSKGKNQ